MKILIDGRFYGLENAGLGRYAINLISQLQKLDNNNQYQLLLKPKYARELKLNKNWQKIKVEFSHYGVSEQTRLMQLINKLNPDLIHFLHFNVPILLNKPFVVTIHDILMHKQKGKESTTLPPLLYKTKRVAYKAVFKKAVMGSQKIVVPSKFAKDELVKYYKINPNKVVVTYEGVDASLIKQSGKNNNKDKHKYFVYAGNAYPHKNLERAIEAILELNKETKEKVEFVIVSGRDVFTKRLRETVDKMNAGKFVKLKGFVTDQGLYNLYNNSVGLLYPSFYEGFGLPGLEAMAAGTLVFCSHIPVFKEVYRDHAIYFNPHDFGDIKKVLKRGLQISESERREKIKNAKAFIKRYSFSKMAKQTLEVYESLE